MRARGIAGRHERRELGREDDDALVAIDYGYFQLEGTEDDDDDEDAEVAQNKLLILVAKGVKIGTYACVRENGVSECATSWCPCCVDLGIAERCCKVMEGHRS